MGSFLPLLLIAQLPCYERPPLEVYVRHDPLDPVHKIWIDRLDRDMKRQPRENIFVIEYDGRLAYKVASKYSKKWIELPAPEAIPTITFWSHFLAYLDSNYWYEWDMEIWKERQKELSSQRWNLRSRVLHGRPAVAERGKPIKVTDNPLDYLLLWK